MVWKGSSWNAAAKSQKPLQEQAQAPAGAWSKPLQEQWKQTQEVQEAKKHNRERAGQELMRMLSIGETCDQMLHEAKHEPDHETPELDDEETPGVKRGRDLLKMISSPAQIPKQQTHGEIQQQQCLSLGDDNIAAVGSWHRQHELQHGSALTQGEPCSQQQQPGRAPGPQLAKNVEPPQTELASNNAQEGQRPQPSILSTTPPAKSVLPPFTPPPLLAAAPLIGTFPMAMPPAPMIGMPPMLMPPFPILGMPGMPMLPGMPPAPILGMPQMLGFLPPPELSAPGFQQVCQAPPPTFTPRLLPGSSVLCQGDLTDSSCMPTRPVLPTIADTVQVPNLVRPLPVGLVAPRHDQYDCISNTNSTCQTDTAVSLDECVDMPAALASTETSCHSESAEPSGEDKNVEEDVEEETETEIVVDTKENDSSGQGQDADKCVASISRGNSLSSLTNGTDDGNEEDAEHVPFVPQHCVQAWEFPLSKSEKQLLYTRLCDQERTVAVQQYQQLKRRMSISHPCDDSDHSSNESEHCEDEEDQKLLMKQRELECQLQSVRTERRRLSLSRP